MKGCTVFKRVILLWLLNSTYSHYGFLLIGALVILIGRLVASKILHESFHLVSDLRGVLCLMLLWVIEAILVHAFMFKIFLRSRCNWTMLWGMVIQLHPHALKLACLIRKTIMLLPEITEILMCFLLVIFPLLRSCIQGRIIVRSRVSILVSRFTIKVKSWDNELFLLSRHCHWKSLFIEIHLFLEPIYLIPTLSEFIISLFESKDHLCVLIDNLFFFSFDML